MSLEKIEISDSSGGARLDVFLAGHLSMTRNQVQRLIREGKITRGASPLKPNDKVKKGDIITVEIPPPRKSEVLPEAIPLNILYQDPWIVVINKPRGLAIHPGGGRRNGTLVNALLYHIKDLSGVGGVERPGIVHRLDKDTSGVMVIAKNDSAHESLSKQFKSRKIKKEYIALVHGVVKKECDSIDTPISRHPKERKKMTVSRTGREAHTRWTVLERFDDFTLLSVKTLTGRTHQIRVHLTSTGFPLAGDEVYGRRKNTLNLRGHVLHACYLGFFHPHDERFMEFTASLPEEIERLLQALRRGPLKNT